MGGKGEKKKCLSETGREKLQTKKIKIDKEYTLNVRGPIYQGQVRNRLRTTKN